MTPREIALNLCRIADTKNARDIGIIDVAKNSDITDYFIICSGRSTTQVKAIAEEIEFQMEKQGIYAMHKEGLVEGKWIALDYGEVIMHIFHEETRAFYQLEKLWNNGTNYEVFKAEE